MSNMPINMTIDRRRTGQSRIQGQAGNNFHGVNISKGPKPGDAYIQGEQNGQTTTLRINSAFSDNGHGVFGRIAGVPFKGNWAQEPTEGDAELFLEGNGSLTIDVNPETGITESQGTAIRSTAKVLNAEGDEELTLLADGRRINMTVDRKEGGNMEIRGRSGDGHFRMTVDRRGDQGDLRFKGTLPESLSLLPVMWELYGDDSVEKPDKPLSMGAVATMSAFWHSKIS
jgi:hypothetical protein